MGVGFEIIVYQESRAADVSYRFCSIGSIKFGIRLFLAIVVTSFWLDAQLKQ